MLNTTPKPAELLTIPEVAKQLRVHETTVRRWINQGTFEAVALPHAGKRTAYRVKQEVLDFLLNHREVLEA